MESKNKTIYVDDDNTNGPWYGTPEHPYCFIQNAIENASSGDTIRVFEGIYDNPNSNLYIDKTLNVIGNGSSNTIIERPVNVLSNDVFFRGFTVYGFDHETLNETYCIKLINSNYCDINNNTLATGLCCIEIYESNYNTIENNLVDEREAAKPCIYLFSSNSNTIRMNHIDNNNDYFGICIYLYHCQGNIIDENIFTNCETAIYTVSSNQIIIKNNTMINGRYGISLLSSSSNCTIIGNNISDYSYGIELKGTSNNNIIGNTILDNVWGIGLYDYYGSNNNNNITGNIILDNRKGILLAGVGNIITNNIISNNEVGIDFYNYKTTIFNNIISSNNISYNEYGIFLSGSRNKITRNIISNNYYGIFLDSHYYFYEQLRFSRFNIIFRNNFIDNEQDSFFLSIPNFWLLNYWNESRVLPKLIFGKINIVTIEIPWINIDWRPALKPYDI